MKILVVLGLLLLDNAPADAQIVSGAGAPSGGDSSFSVSAEEEKQWQRFGSEDGIPHFPIFTPVIHVGESQSVIKHVKKHQRGRMLLKTAAELKQLTDDQICMQLESTTTTAARINKARGSSRRLIEINGPLAVVLAVGGVLNVFTKLVPAFTGIFSWLNTWAEYGLVKLSSNGFPTALLKSALSVLGKLLSKLASPVGLLIVTITAISANVLYYDWFAEKIEKVVTTQEIGHSNLDNKLTEQQDYLVLILDELDTRPACPADDDDAKTNSNADETNSDGRHRELSVTSFFQKLLDWIRRLLGRGPTEPSFAPIPDPPIFADSFIPQELRSQLEELSNTNFTLEVPEIEEFEHELGMLAGKADAAGQNVSIYQEDNIATQALCCLADGTGIDLGITVNLIDSFANSFDLFTCFAGVGVEQVIGSISSNYQSIVRGQRSIAELAESAAAVDWDKAQSAEIITDWDYKVTELGQGLQHLDVVPTTRELVPLNDSPGVSAFPDDQVLPVPSEEDLGIFSAAASQCADAMAEYNGGGKNCSELFPDRGPKPSGSNCCSNADCESNRCVNFIEGVFDIERQCSEGDVDDPCEYNEDCKDGRCVLLFCRSGLEGAPCEKNSDCEDDRCVLLFCRSGLVGAPCEKNSDCENDRCVLFLCRSGLEGAVCEVDSDCENDLCVLLFCRSGLEGALCEVESDCQDGLTCEFFFGVTFRQCTAKLANGGGCNEDADCISDRCDLADLTSYKCFAKEAAGGWCNENSDCLSESCTGYFGCDATNSCTCE